MKKTNLIRLLVLVGVFIASINTAWAVKYTPTKGVNGGSAVYGVVPQGAVMQSTGMQSQQIMSSGSAYTGTVYAPFSGTTPSEANGPARVGGPRKAGWYDENGDYHTDEGEFYTGGEDKPSSQSPIGEPWVMVLFALGFAGVIAIRQYKRKTVKSMDMKNSTGKFVAALALLCTLGVGQMKADTYYLRYMENMPNGNYDGTTSQIMTQSSGNIYYCELTLNTNSSYGFFIRVNDSETQCWKAPTRTVSTYEEVTLNSYGGTHGNSNHRLTYSTGTATKYLFIYNISSHKISVCPKDVTVKVSWNIAEGHDGDYNLANYTDPMTQIGTSNEYYVDVDFTAVKHYMFIQTDLERYWKAASTLTIDGSAVTLNNKGTYNYGDTGDKVNFTPSVAGKYRFTWNHVDKSVKIQRVYLVTYDANGSSGGSKPGDKYYPNGETVTAASNSGSLYKTNYSFGDWNTANDGSGTNYTAGSGTFSMGTSTKTLYAKWTQGTTVNANGGGSNSTYTAIWNNGSITIASAPTRTGYRLNGYYAESGCTNKIAASNGALQSGVTISSTTWTNASGKWAHTAAAATIYAGWDANTYTVHFNGNGSDGGSTDDEAFTYGTAKTLTANGFTRTGYTFAGWNTEANGSGSSYTNGQSVSNLTPTHEGTVNLHAQWTANTYTISLDGDEPNKGTAGTRAVSGSATYDASMPAQTGTLPTAANGYHFMGFYSLQNGDGVKVIDEDGNWVASADGYTDASTHWVHADDATLYAYFKKAEVTAISFTEALVEKETTAEAEITVSPSPAGSTNLCFKLLYNSGAELADQPSFTYNGSTHKVTFTAPETPGSYKLQVILRLGSDECSGTVLDAEDESFTVAGPNVVTIKYMYGDTKTEIKSSTTVDGDPLTWKEASVGDASNDPIGYTFSTWELGDGMTLNTEGGYALTNRTIQFKSTYNATLKAKYTKKNIIYFYNTLGWEDVYVYFYTSDGYWSANYGTGAYMGKKFDSKSPFWDMHYGQMTQIEGTNIWYFDYTARGWDGWRYIAFANMDKANSGTDDTGNNDLGYFANTTANPIEVVRRGDHYTALPMYVPYNSESSAQFKNDNKAKYFFQGFWMNYPESTGLAIRIYDSKKGDGIHGSYIREVPFELPATNATPMTFKTDLEGNKTYGFKLVRHGSSDEWYGNGGTMSNGHSGVNGDVWDFRTGQASDCGLTTSSAGEYEFSLSFGLDNSSAYNFLVGVKYPEATGDYRVLYKDDNTSGEWFVSHVIPRLLDKDTISFFVRPNANPKMKMQKCSATWNGSTTTVTWTDTITEANNMLSSMPAAITAGGDGVYYFCMNKGEDGERVMGDVAAYEGSYYIRTDAAPSQWDNYRNTDHKMTYSEYAEEHNSDPAYTHYYMKYATIGTNVKFVVANDYSPYISDTTTTGAHVSGTQTLNANANIRFMWDRRNNSVGREFIAPAQNDGSRFLVMQGEAEKLLAPNGTALDGYDEAHPGNNKGGGLNAIQFTDKQDWIYTADVKAVPGGRIKLYKAYDGGTHYIFGDNDASFADTHAIELIGGTGDASAQTIRAIYDFKTNRLMTAWIPADTVKQALTLNADIMIVREHQDAATNIVLNGSGKIDLATGKMIYGVMRFNRYTLNNREKTGGHSPLDLSNYKSQYERSMYYISFPFDVKINEIFGMGEYGKHWIMQRYRGDQRAQKGFWIDSGSYWKFMGPDMTLNANEGYILTLDLNKFDYDETEEGEVWHNGVEEIELYFPAAEAVNITQVADFELPALDSTIYKCTINRGDGTDGDRRIKDSYWRCIGVPSFADYSGVVKDSVGNDITWKPDGLPFLYDINWADKSITAYSGKNFPFKAMHAYLVQNGSSIHWKNVYTYAPPTPVAAPRRSRDELSEIEFRLEINQLDSMIDQTYVRMCEEEGVTNEFDFGQDMSKEFNAGANIYTFIGYEQVAANSMPLSDQTTIVPVGIKIVTDGDYTFAMPEGTNGVGVILIDNIAGTRTNLSLTDYTVNLTTGTYDGRFSLEISPIAQTPTGIENTEHGTKNTEVRKVMVDGILYIVKDGKVFDARGNRVQ